MTDAQTEAVRTWLADWADAKHLGYMTIAEIVEQCRADAMLSHGIRAVELEAAVGNLERYFMDHYQVGR